MSAEQNKHKTKKDSEKEWWSLTALGVSYGTDQVLMYEKSPIIMQIDVPV